MNTITTPTSRPRRRALRIAGLAAGLGVLGASLATGGTALAEERTCRSAIGAVTLDNVRVPVGSTCVLTGTYVRGTVKVERGASLIATNVRIVGNVQSEGHRRVELRTSRVGGSVQLVQGGVTGVRTAVVYRNRVNGDIQLFSNRGVQYVLSNVVGGNLQCKGNVPAPVGGGNVVGGNKEDQCSRL